MLKNYVVLTAVLMAVCTPRPSRAYGPSAQLSAYRP